MTCRDVKALVAGMVLDELDVERRRVVEEHLGACAACAREREASVRTLEMLRRLPPVESSSSRRDRAVEALHREHLNRVEAVLMGGRSTRRMRIYMSMAAAVALLIVGAVLLRPLFEVSTRLEVVDAQGRARIMPADSDGWRDLTPGVLRRGDRLMTETGEAWIVIAQYAGAEEIARFRLGADASMKVEEGQARGLAHLILERGGITADLHRNTAGLRLGTPFGEELVVREGRLEAEVERASMMDVAGSREEKPQPIEGADLEFRDVPAGETCEQMGALLGIQIDARTQRPVTFFGISTAADLRETFFSALRGQQFEVREEEGHWVVTDARPVVREPESRLVVRTWKSGR